MAQLRMAPSTAADMSEEGNPVHRGADEAEEGAAPVRRRAAKNRVRINRDQEDIPMVCSHRA